MQVAVSSEKVCICRKSSSEKMQLLIDYGADIERRVYKCDGTSDEHASENDYENPDGCGTTPLMMACKAGVLEAVEVLLEE